MLIAFIAGIPCSGKSLVAEQIVRYVKNTAPNISIKHMDDFKIFWDMVQQDVDHSHHRPTDDGGIKITNKGFWSELNKELVKTVLDKVRKVDLLLVEVARSKYIELLRMFPRSVLDSSLVIYIDSPWPLAWQRNIKRGTLEKVRFISREEMENTFRTSDYRDIEGKLGLSLVILKNDSNAVVELRNELKRAIIPLLAGKLQHDSDSLIMASDKK